MRPSQMLRGVKHPGGLNLHIGPWGASGCQPQKGVVQYGLAQNRQNPLAGSANAAIFNTFRRTRHQILYWAVPMVIAYQCMQWAIERNEYLNSKAGIAEYGDQE